MPSFEITEITGDVGIRAYGRNLKELFAHAASGLTELTTASSSIRSSRSLDLSVTGVSAEGLLVAWLNELIFRLDAHGFVGAHFDILQLDLTDHNCSLEATVTGEDFNEDRHERRLLVKAATYHNLKIEPTQEGYTAEIIFDI